MLRALQSDPDVGLVGPCSNRVSGPQQVAAGYDDLAGLDGFAWDWGKAHDGGVEDTDRLVGFCLLIRRELIDAIGLLDERFGIGCFEDDDYCLRAPAGRLPRRDRPRRLRPPLRRPDLRRQRRRLRRPSCARTSAQFRDKWARARSRPRGRRAGATPSPAACRRPGRAAYTVVAAPGGGLLLRRQRGPALALHDRPRQRPDPAGLPGEHPPLGGRDGRRRHRLDATRRRGIAAVRRRGSSISPGATTSRRPATSRCGTPAGEWLFWMDSDDTITPECGRRLRELAYGEADPSMLGYVVQVHCPGAGEDGGPGRHGGRPRQADPQPARPAVRGPDPRADPAGHPPRRRRGRLDRPVRRPLGLRPQPRGAGAEAAARPAAARTWSWRSGPSTRSRSSTWG